jgi:hypothetical protein
VRAAFSEDTTIIQIIQDGEAICRSIGQPSATPEIASPSGTAIPVVTLSASASPSPTP